MLYGGSRLKYKYEREEMFSYLRSMKCYAHISDSLINDCLNRFGRDAVYETYEGKKWFLSSASWSRNFPAGLGRGVFFGEPPLLGYGHGYSCVFCHTVFEESFQRSNVGCNLYLVIGDLLDAQSPIAKDYGFAGASFLCPTCEGVVKKYTLYNGYMTPENAMSLDAATTMRDEVKFYRARERLSNKK